MINEKEQEEIRIEAKKILDNFASALGKVDIKRSLKRKRLKSYVGGFREVEDGLKGDEDFRKRMFENSPKKEGDCIIAEKKKW